MPKTIYTSKQLSTLDDFPDIENFGIRSLTFVNKLTGVVIENAINIDASGNLQFKDKTTEISLRELIEGSNGYFEDINSVGETVLYFHDNNNNKVTLGEIYESLFLTNVINGVKWFSKRAEQTLSGDCGRMDEQLVEDFFVTETKIDPIDYRLNQTLKVDTKAWSNIWHDVPCLEVITDDYVDNKYINASSVVHYKIKARTPLLTAFRIYDATADIELARNVHLAGRSEDFVCYTVPIDYQGPMPDTPISSDTGCKKITFKDLQNIQVEAGQEKGAGITVSQDGYAIVPLTKHVIKVQWCICDLAIEFDNLGNRIADYNREFVDLGQSSLDVILFNANPTDSDITQLNGKVYFDLLDVNTTEYDVKFDLIPFKNVDDYSISLGTNSNFNAWVDTKTDTGFLLKWDRSPTHGIIDWSLVHRVPQENELDRVNDIDRVTNHYIFGEQLNNLDFCGEVPEFVVEPIVIKECIPVDTIVESVIPSDCPETIMTNFTKFLIPEITDFTIDNRNALDQYSIISPSVEVTNGACITPCISGTNFLDLGNTADPYPYPCPFPFEYDVSTIVDGTPTTMSITGCLPCDIADDQIVPYTVPVFVGDCAIPEDNLTFVDNVDDCECCDCCDYDLIEVTWKVNPNKGSDTIPVTNLAIYFIEDDYGNIRYSTSQDDLGFIAVVKNNNGQKCKIEVEKYWINPDENLVINTKVDTGSSNCATKNVISYPISTESIIYLSQINIANSNNTVRDSFNNLSCDLSFLPYDAVEINLESLYNKNYIFDSLPFTTDIQFINHINTINDMKAERIIKLNTDIKNKDMVLPVYNVDSGVIRFDLPKDEDIYSSIFDAEYLKIFDPLNAISFLIKEKGFLGSRAMGSNIVIFDPRPNIVISSDERSLFPGYDPIYSKITEEELLEFIYTTVYPSQSIPVFPNFRIGDFVVNGTMYNPLFDIRNYRLSGIYTNDTQSLSYSDMFISKDPVSYSTFTVGSVMKITSNSELLDDSYVIVKNDVFNSTPERTTLNNGLIQRVTSSGLKFESISEETYLLNV